MTKTHVSKETYVFNKYQLEALMERVKDEGDTIDVEICQHRTCDNVIGILEDPDDDLTGTDAVYQISTGGGICGKCHNEFHYKSCDRCEYYFLAYKMTRIDNADEDEPDTYLCRDCYTPSFI